MSFEVFADGSANLPKDMLEGISLLPCEYTVDGEPHTYWGDVDSFDGHAYYESLRNGRKIGTSLLNAQVFLKSHEQQNHFSRMRGYTVTASGQIELLYQFTGYLHAFGQTDLCQPAEIIRDAVFFGQVKFSHDVCTHFLTDQIPGQFRSVFNIGNMLCR